MSKQPAAATKPTGLQVDTVPVESITRNPDNYRAHPPEQVQAIRESLEQFGQYRPLVLSSDGVLLAGEGVLDGAIAGGQTHVEVTRMPFPAADPRAKKLLVADNTLSRMAQDDDTALAALLASIQQTSEGGLSGTGYDDGELDALIGEMAAEEFGETQDVSRELGETDGEYVDATFRVSRDQLEVLNGALGRTGMPSKTDALMAIVEAYSGG